MFKTVYLAGPISGLTYETSTQWRDEVVTALNRSSIKAVSPLRAKVYLRDLGPIKDSYEGSSLDGNAFVNMSTERGITARDRFDCTNCSLLFVNLLGTTKVSIGTCMEIAWADANRIPIVLVIDEKDNPHDHAMIRDCISFRAKTLLDGVEIVKAILGDY